MTGKTIRELLRPGRWWFRTASTLVFAGSAVLLTLSACSDGENTAPPYTVQAGIDLDDAGGHAFAVVVDSANQAVTDALLTINGVVMNYGLPSDQQSRAVEAEPTPSAEDGYAYWLELPDLEGGDVVTLLAASAGGVILHGPTTAVVPMPVELLAPTEGQPIVAGEAIPIRWTGGAGATVLTAAYGALDGSALYWDDFPPPGTPAFTIPTGKTVAGTGIVGVGATTGDIGVMGSISANFTTPESYFLVTREAAVSVDVASSANLLPDAGRAVVAGTCPYGGGMGKLIAAMACTGQFAALGIGAIIWEVRRVAEFKACPVVNAPCNNIHANNWAYCVQYGYLLGHLNWRAGCLKCANGFWGTLQGPCN